MVSVSHVQFSWAEGMINRTPRKRRRWGWMLTSGIWWLNISISIECYIQKVSWGLKTRYNLDVEKPFPRLWNQNWKQCADEGLSGWGIRCRANCKSHLDLGFKKRAAAIEHKDNFARHIYYLDFAYCWHWRMNVGRYLSWSSLCRMWSNSLSVQHDYRLS